jgi:hypothetical protein
MRNCEQFVVFAAAAIFVDMSLSPERFKWFAEVGL